VSENDNCHWAGTAKVALKVMGRNAWREKPWGDLGKQT